MVTKRMSPLRKKILAAARKYDGQLMTADRAMWFQGTLNSLDDTADDKEVWSFLQWFAKGCDPDVVISATGRDNQLVKVRVDEQGHVSVVGPGFSRS